jgi:PAS domain S-box-containing protein
MFDDLTLPHRHYSLRNDFLILAAAAVVIFILASATNAFEKAIQYLRFLEHFQLDEVFVTLGGLSISMLVLLMRRWRYMAAEAAFHREVARHLIEERILLRTLIDHLPDYIFVKDAEGRFVVSNLSHARAVQSSPAQIIGKTAYDVFPSEVAAQFQVDDEAVMRSGQPLINAERVTIDAAGNQQLVLTTKIPLMDNQGHATGLVGISRDITHRKAEEQRALALVRERDRVKLMTGFTKEAMHDFRTPLSTIMTSVYLLLKSTEPAQQQRHARTIENAVMRLSHLLDGITTMTRLDSLTELESRVTDVNELLQLVAATTASIDTRPGLQPRLTLDRSLPWVCGSVEDLRQVFANLVDNAMQSTPEGGQITIRTAQQGEMVLVEVQDTGVGISLDDLPHIFDRFYRTDRARSLETGGIGLGLSIAKKIVELHHGRIEVESQPDKGSTFRVYLPITASKVLGESCHVLPAA